MANLQYIGARYVPKFYLNPDDSSNDWKSGVLYEALTIVTYNNDSYTSKVTVPATVGNPADNPQYWACTTKYTAALVALQSSVGDLENDVDSLNALKEFVTPEMFGAIGDGVNDDSDAWQAALDSGKIVLASNTYKLHNVRVAGGNVHIIGNNTKIYPVMNSNNLEDEGLLFDGCDSVIVEGIEFTNPNRVVASNPSLRRKSAVKFNSCKVATLDGCYFHDMSLGAVGINNDVLTRDGVAFTFRDCDHSIIRNCILKGYFEDELSFIAYDQKSMDDIDVLIENCKVYDWQTATAFNVFAGTINLIGLYTAPDCNALTTSLSNFICNYFNMHDCEINGFFGNYAIDLSEALWYKCKSVNITDCIFNYAATGAGDFRAIRVQSDMAVFENCTFKNQLIYSLNELTPAAMQDKFRDYYAVLTTDDILIVKNSSFTFDYPCNANAKAAIAHLVGIIDKVIVEDCSFDLGSAQDMGSVDARDCSLIFKNNSIKNANGSPVSSAYTYGPISVLTTTTNKSVEVAGNEYDGSIVSAAAYISGNYKSVKIHHAGNLAPYQMITNNNSAYYADIETPYYSGNGVCINAVEYKGIDDRVLRSLTPVGNVRKGEILGDATHAYLVTSDGAISVGAFTDNSTIIKYTTYDRSGVCYKALAGGVAGTVVDPATPTVGEVYTIGGIKFLCVALQKATTATIY